MKRAPLFLPALWVLALSQGTSFPPARAVQTGAPPAVPRPEAAAGPFRVVVDRIIETRNVTATFRTEPRRASPALDSRRSVQLHLGVYAPDRQTGTGLATFQVSGLSVAAGSRQVEVPHHGGILENPNDTAVVRAYLYLPSFPAQVDEVRALYGEIVAYEKSGPLDLDLPLDGDGVPRVVERDGVKLTLRELFHEGTGARVTFSVEAPPGSILVNPVSDGTYGVALSSRENRAASPNGGSMAQPRENQQEYRLAFANLQGPPGRLRLRLAFRGGARHVYPFRLERVPIPTRRHADSPPGAEAKQ